MGVEATVQLARKVDEKYQMLSFPWKVTSKADTDFVLKMVYSPYLSH